jgi:hypothetical protein
MGWHAGKTCRERNVPESFLGIIHALQSQSHAVRIRMTTQNTSKWNVGAQEFKPTLYRIYIKNTDSLWLQSNKNCSFCCTFCPTTKHILLPISSIPSTLACHASRCEYYRLQTRRSKVWFLLYTQDLRIFNGGTESLEILSHRWRYEDLECT